MSSTHKLPSNPHEWQALAKRNGLVGSTIHTASLSSASTIEEDQYLLFRVLWKIHPIKQFDWKRFDLNRWEAKANEHLANYSSWKTYCDGLARRTISESTFALAHYFQLQAADTWDETWAPNVAVTPIARRTRSKTAKLDTESPLVSASPGPGEIQNLIFQQTKDEQIVNTALVNFLSALTLHAGLANHWTLHRKSFKAHFTHAFFEARTDGYLEDTKPGGKVRALIEVKAVPRERKRKMICMQEAAQMVAWILCHPDRSGCLNFPGRRIHVFQDRHQIYIVIAEYGDNYIDYLEKGYSSDAYMVMHEFGPWDSNDLKHMKDISVILVAFVLRAVSDCKAEERMPK
ncbi:hypothetical protein AJ78_03249 [Emergomyces pasteurianus Ep9510]|uniref:Fungal-type protein kinase domain-containing protein n=1 Tax=Emergomyces pasteurianus Ep9510 TaxID=1447872 RepID=A0A1J9PJI0_9EURO|nr:hypothetical protein AJ78_03249 [Emergomyces pasteurianus Ep9510]